MIHAYDNQYLDDAMKCQGEAMDYVANCCQMNMDCFLNCLLARVMRNSLLQVFQNMYPVYPVQSL